MQDALEKVSAGLTTVVIAHRLSTIRNANRILVFDQGTIIEQGNHEELLALNGVYANMVHLQSVSATKSKVPPHELKKTTHKVNKPGKDELKERPAPKKAVTRWYVIKKLFKSHWRESWYLNALGTLAGVCQGSVFPILGFVFAHALLSIMLYTGDELRVNLDFWVVILVSVGFGGFAVIYVQNLTFLNSAARFTHTLRYGLFSNIIRQAGFWFDYKGHEAAVFESMLAQEVPLIHRVSGRLLGQLVKIISCIVVAFIIGCLNCWHRSPHLSRTVPPDAHRPWLCRPNPQGLPELQRGRLRGY